MPLPKTVNVDRIVQYVLEDTSDAVGDWRDCGVLHELGLLCNLTRHLRRRHQNCNVGTQDRVVATTQLVPLHGKGEGGKDRFGSDLAVSLTIPTEKFETTALLQLKPSDKGKVKLERQQLEDALYDKRIGIRSFVAAIDKVSGEIYLRDATSLAAQWKGNQHSQTFDCRQWMPLSQWTTEWVSGNIGKPENPDDLGSVRRILEMWALDPKQPLIQDENGRFDLPDEVIPTRALLAVELSPPKRKRRKS